jgi:alpha-glucoside transport system substrate-binding protein
MAQTSVRKALIAATASFALVLSACGSDTPAAESPSITTSSSGQSAGEPTVDPSATDGGGSETTETSGETSSGSETSSSGVPASDPNWCETLKGQFPDIEGTSVSIYTSITSPEDTGHINSYKPFEECTGVTVNYEGSKEFETQLPIRVQSGTAPDLAYIPQPGLLKSLVFDTGAVIPAPQTVADNVTKWFGQQWIDYGSVDGTLFASPLGANVKSFVWYSPAQFKENGWEVPETLDELKTLSDTIAATGKKPWCAGVESGTATGWPATDWVEDFVLRTQGPDVYAQWYNHEIPSDDPAIVAAVDAAGEYLRNPEYMNAGFGDVASITATAFQDAGKGIPTGECFLHRQASFYAANFPEGTNIAEDGDAYAFYLPAGEDFGKPVLVGGEFVAAFRDAPEVQAFQTYLSSDVWANEKAKQGDNGWLSANKGLDASNIVGPIDKLSVEIIQDPEAITAFDASDLMPDVVGKAFWASMTTWLRDGADTATVLGSMEAAWPE